MPLKQSSTDNSFKIGDLCASSGLSKPTIIHYIKIGLLPPPLKVKSNLHLYNETHLETLSLIIRLRQEECLSLQEIKTALTNGRIPSILKRKQALPSSGASFLSKEDPVMGKRRRIVEKAIKLFSRHGYENVKISDITDAIQIGKGTFYHYFKDKKELLHECFTAIKDFLLSTENDGNLLMEKNIVKRMKTRFFSLQSQYPHFNSMLLMLQIMAYSEDPMIRKSAIDSYRSIIKLLLDDINDSKENGFIVTIDPELMAYAILGIWENIGFRLCQDTKYSYETAANEVEELMKRILMPVKIRD